MGTKEYYSHSEEMELGKVIIFVVLLLCYTHIVNAKTTIANKDQTTKTTLISSTDVIQTPRATNTKQTTQRENSITSTPNPRNETNTTSDPHHDPNDEDSEHSEGHGEGIQLVPVHLSNVKYPLVFTLVVIFTSLSKLAFHYSHTLSSILPESCMLIILGLIFGVILNFSGLSENLTFFAPHEFFLFLLPPIILEAAFSLHDRTFAENIGSVLLYAVLGTILNCFAIGLSLYGLYKVGAMEEINCTLVQLLVFSALIVAVDPVAVLAVFQEVGVNSTLYFLVFGESLLNDGVTVVLYNVMQILNKMTDITIATIFMGFAKFFVVVICGTLIGVICGLLSSFITKFTNSVKVIEPLIIFGFAYLSYVLSELFEFSGIISIIACGILQVHYAFHNITNKSRLAIKFFAKVMATASEIIIFLFLGIATINPNHVWKTGFTIWTVLLCIVFRFIITYTLSIAVNHFSSGKIRKIKFDEMFMISYGGLRGAVCFSLVALIDEDEIPMKRLFITTTLFVIFFTVFVQGGTIKWLVRKLRVTLATKETDMSLSEEMSSHVFDHIMAGIEEILGYTTGTHHIKLKIEHFDDTVIKPRILRDATQSDLDDISHYYEKLVMKEHFKNLKLGGAHLPHVKTEIRHLDSELALAQIGDDVDERECHRRHERRQGKLHKKHNQSFGDNLHKFLSHTMHTARSKLHLNAHDKNVVHDRKHHLLTHLRRKRQKNIQLMQLKSAESSPPGLQKVDLSTELHLNEVARKTSQVTFQLHDEDEENGYTQLDIDDDDSEDRHSGKVVFSF